MVKTYEESTKLIRYKLEDIKDTMGQAEEIYHAKKVDAFIEKCVHRDAQQERCVEELEIEIGRIKNVARETLWKWAWWNDGTQYVGHCFTHYADASIKLEKELEGEDG